MEIKSLISAFSSNMRKIYKFIGIKFFVFFLTGVSSNYIFHQ